MTVDTELWNFGIMEFQNFKVRHRYRYMDV